MYDCINPQLSIPQSDKNHKDYLGPEKIEKHDYFTINQELIT